MLLPIYYFIIAITVYLSWQAWQKPEYLQKLVLYPYGMKGYKQPYRLLSSGFVHADWGHLLFNMITLYFFSQPLMVSWYKGGASNVMIWFVALYLTGIVISSIPSFLKHQNNRYYKSLGASGGVSAILFASIILNPLSDIYLMFIPIGIKSFLFGFLYLGYSYYMAKRSNDLINHDAHLAGSIYGIVFSTLLVPESTFDAMNSVKIYILNFSL